MFKLLIPTIIALLYLHATAVPKLDSFAQLAEHHCKAYDLKLLYQIASGGLGETHGPKFKQYDAYIRTFVGPDLVYRDQDKDESDQEEQNPYEEDWVVTKYVQGLAECGLDWTEKQVYTIWRFVRFIVNSDYLLEWLRAKMRISYGYQIQRPSSWMDGMQREDRLRLDKLYSNQYLDSLQTLMYRDYLYPLVTTLRKNTVFALSGSYTQSGKPLLVNIIQTRNYPVDLFCPVEISINGESFFSFTIPGIPLLISGSSQRVAWAFSGILVDRTNVEQIQTTGMRYFNEDTQRWIKIRRVEDSIKVKGQEDYNVSYFWSREGPLVQKSEAKSKIKQYIVKWHENEPKVRRLFSQLVQLITHPSSRPVLHFPFNSLVLIDSKGIHHHICPPTFPYYFLYPDMLGEPQNFDGKQLWASNPKKGFFVASNTYLSSIKPTGYLDKELFSADEQALAALFKQWKDTKQDTLSMVNQTIETYETSNAKRIVNNLMTVYRKAKFTYLPDQAIRNECDQLVVFLDNWDFKLNSPKIGLIYRLWLYFLKTNTFGHTARSPLARDIARFKLATNTYFAGQTELWKGVASYGECNIDQYRDHIQHLVNHTSHNSSCYYNIFKSINQTRLFLKTQGGSLLNTKDEHFNQKITWNPLTQQYLEKVGDKETAFLSTFKEKLILASELGHRIVFSTNGPINLRDFKFGQSTSQSGLDVQPAQPSPAQAIDQQL